MRELMLNEFEVGHNAAEAPKNMFLKAEGVVDHSRVAWCIETFLSSCKNLDD